MEISFLILVGLIAMLYASVGHGGASGYLALMALYGFAPQEMKPTALILNLIVAGVSFLQFYRKGYFKFNLFLSLAITSIPAAFLGGYILPDPTLYRQILGVVLAFVVLRMLGLFGGIDKKSDKSPNLIMAMILGGGIGLLSGMIGIGGGIILSPLIVLLGWADIKESAGVAALFIWVNSLAGLSGHLASGYELQWNLSAAVAVASIGGFAGGYLGSYQYNKSVLRIALSVVLAVASIKLMIL